jgi:hypothetical protein
LAGELEQLKMKTYLYLALIIWLTGAPPALANNPPGPVGFSLLVLMPLSVLFFSVIGGVYDILDCRNGFLKFLGAFLLIILSAGGGSVAFFVAILFGLVILTRALQMIDWAQQIKRSNPGQEGASKPRLLLCATGLLLTYVVLFVTRIMYYEWPRDTIRDYMIPAVVKGNMRTCQIAAEEYAESHSGLYPDTVNDKAFRSYFQEGSKGSPFKPGLPPINPVTRKWDRFGVISSDGYEGIGTHEWPVNGKITDVRAARQQAPTWVGKGVVEYSAIYDQKHKPVSYAIRGGDFEGLAVKGIDRTLTLVLSNQ